MSLLARMMLAGVAMAFYGALGIVVLVFLLKFIGF